MRSQHPKCVSSRILAWWRVWGNFPRTSKTTREVKDEASWYHYHFKIYIIYSKHDYNVINIEDAGEGEGSSEEFQLIVRSIVLITLAAMIMPSNRLAVLLYALRVWWKQCQVTPNRLKCRHKNKVATYKYRLTTKRSSAGKGGKSAALSGACTALRSRASQPLGLRGRFSNKNCYRQFRSAAATAIQMQL